MLNDLIKTHRIIKELRNEIKNSFWHNVYKSKNEVLLKKNKQLKKILKWKKYKGYDAFENERNCLKSEIVSAKERTERAYETVSNEQERTTILENEITDLLDMKDRYYKLIAAIEIRDMADKENNL